MADDLVFRAAFDGDLATVKRLVAEGADLEARSDLGQTPLHLAIENDNVEVVKFLLESGADPNGLTSGGITPLCHAIEVEGDAASQLGRDEQSTAIIELLLAHDAEVNLPCVWDRVHAKSPLAEAWHYGNWKAVELLKAAGAKLMEGEALAPAPGHSPPVAVPSQTLRPGLERRVGQALLILGTLLLGAAGVCESGPWTGHPWGGAAGPLAGMGLMSLCGGGRVPAGRPLPSVKP